MNIRITIETGNAAFGDSPQECGTEVARILRDLADKLEETDPEDYDGAKLMDYNGNKVGRFHAQED